MKSPTKILFFTILLMTYGTFVLAAPEINPTAPNSVLVDGMTFSISGSSFGIKPIAAPIKFDNFESYPEGGYIVNTGPSPQWANSGSSSGYPEVDNARSISGSQSVFSDFTPLNDGDCNFVHGDLNFKETNELYASYWVYWYNLTGVDAKQGRSDFFKMSRFNSGTPYSGAPYLKPEFWVDYGNPEGLDKPRGYLQYQYGSDSSYVTYKSTGSNQFTHGTWHRIEMYMKLSVTAGEHEFYIDGNSVNVALDVGTAANTTGGKTGLYNYFQLNLSGCGYASNDHPYMWQDDVYVDNTRARVEICEGSKWSSRGVCNIQIPISWENTNIAFTINQGGFSNNQEVFLYVIDQNGQVSENNLKLTIKETIIDPPPNVRSGS